MTEHEALSTLGKDSPLLTREQQDYCDSLLRFCEHCGGYDRALRYGIKPLTYGAFLNAVVMRMPDKTDQEKLYLISMGKHYFRFV